VTFKPSEIIALQDAVQEKPLFLMQGEVFMQRRIKDSVEQRIIEGQNYTGGSGSEQLSIKDILRSNQTRGSKMKKAQGDQRLVGVVKPGKWLYHLSYLLKIPLNATF
jgi:hypothetical protein